MARAGLAAAAFATAAGAWAGAAPAAAGTLLIGWILVELAFIRSLSFLHPIYFGVGFAFLLAGRFDRAKRTRGAHPW
jgi:hypothetical protein